VTSPVTISTGKVLKKEESLEGRWSARTELPTERSSSHKVLPIKPVAPVTRAFIIDIKLLPRAKGFLPALRAHSRQENKD
jgi:hypothetical protein